MLMMATAQQCEILPKKEPEKKLNNMSMNEMMPNFNGPRAWRGTEPERAVFDEAQCNYPHLYGSMSFSSYCWDGEVCDPLRTKWVDVDELESSYELYPEDIEPRDDPYCDEYYMLWLEHLEAVEDAPFRTELAYEGLEYDDLEDIEALSTNESPRQTIFDDDGVRQHYVPIKINPETGKTMFRAIHYHDSHGWRGRVPFYKNHENDAPPWRVYKCCKR